MNKLLIKRITVYDEEKVIAKFLELDKLGIKASNNFYHRMLEYNLYNNFKINVNGVIGGSVDDLGYAYKHWSQMMWSFGKRVWWLDVEWVAGEVELMLKQQKKNDR